MRQILAQLLGCTLRGVTEARHWCAGARGDGDDALIDVWLHFHGRPTVHVTGSADGSRLMLAFDEPYDTYELGGYGEFRVAAVGPTALLSKIIGHRLASAAVIDGQCGAVFRFDHRDLVIAYLRDDFILALDEVPTGLAHLCPGPWLVG